jgi:hypothetical protein
MMPHPTENSIHRIGSWMLVFALLVSVAGCRQMTEEEALEAAREEIRGEMRPEIDRKQKEIEDLRREIAATRSRMAAQDDKPD